jgi:hypothetical protein
MAGSRDFSLREKFQTTALGLLPASYSMGTAVIK